MEHTQTQGFTVMITSTHLREKRRIRWTYGIMVQDCALLNRLINCMSSFQFYLIVHGLTRRTWTWLSIISFDMAGWLRTVTVGAGGHNNHALDRKVVRFTKLPLATNIHRLAIIVCHFAIFPIEINWFKNLLNIAAGKWQTHWKPVSDAFNNNFEK